MRTARAVLLDLDGTLLDTAPDMTRALNRLRVLEGRDELPPAQVRPHVSHGAARLVHLGFGEVPEAEFERLRLAFLDLYREALAVETRLFDGFDAVFAHLRASDIPWGVVTNKPGWLTDPLLVDLGLAGKAACVVSGDTVAERKPHPLPLLHAARLVGIEPSQCLYVGDAERDIVAGRAAGMRTLIAGWGYIGAEDTPEDWGAEATATSPLDLLDWLDSAAPTPEVKARS